MKTENPYQPIIVDANPKPDPRLSLLASMIPASLAILFTVPLWLVSVTTLQGLLGDRFLLAIWAACLFASSAVSVTVLNLRSPVPPKSAGYALTFALLGAVYASFQLNTLDSLYWEVAYAYGVLAILPVWAYVISRLSCDKILSKIQELDQQV